MARWARDPDERDDCDDAAYSRDADFARGEKTAGGERGFEGDEDDGDDRDFPLESDMDDDDNPEVVPCPNCREPVSEIAEKCPHCGDWIMPGGAESLGRRGWVYASVAVVMAVALVILATRGC